MANFYDRFSTAATRFPDRTAIELQAADQLLATTYRELEQQGAGIAAWLHAQGVAADDRVAILADNDARWIAAYMGVLRLGATAVPLDTAYKAGQVRTVIDNSGARLIFTTARYLDRVREGVSEWPGFVICLLHGKSEGLPDFDVMQGSGAAPPVASRGDHDAAVILYTSGTTADPKGVVLTHANLDAERLAAFSVVDVTERDAVLGVLPLFHSLAQMANLLLPLAVGARVVFLETVSSTSLLNALQTRGITILCCVPQFFYLIHQRVMTEVGKASPVRRALFRTLKSANGWLRDHGGMNPGRRWFAKIHNVLGPQMRVLVTGGSKFDATIGRDLYDLGFNLLNAYGLTETSGGATIVRQGDTFTTSVGQPLKGVEVRIAPRESGDDAREHEDGEILIRGPIVMREYFKRPDANAETLKDGWLYTGDLGRLDAEGRLYITGRKKEMIVLASGKNLYPEEIEAHYREAPTIKELCVLGFNRNDDAGGERLHAVIVPDEDVLRSRGVVNVQQLIRFELEGRSVHLPPHKRILTYDIWMEPLPRTSTGKIRRHQIETRLRSQAATAQASESETVTPEETAWLQVPAHAQAMAAVTARLDKPVRPDANLDLDLALDSMERVELLTLIEQQQGRRVTPETRATIFTVRQLVDAVLKAAPHVSVGAAKATPYGDGDDHSTQMWEGLLTQPTDPALAEELGRSGFVRALLFFVVMRALRPFLRVRVYGLDHLPAKGPYILSPNHQSYLDPFVLVSALPFRAVRNCFAVGAAEYYQTPFMKRVARFTNVIPVDADSNLESAMKAGAAGLRLGKVLILFPEGERSIDGELKPFRKGAAILSAHLNAPIVPVAMDGLFPLWPRSRSFQSRHLLPGSGLRVPLEFGAPVTVERGKYAEGTAALRAGVERMFLAMRRNAQ
ncbi:MAG TPA: AMP-binding protein [Vicinamibacterales bacterium]|nr:AMP-binding protein [Vicinamibacterales bacterium]